MLLDGSARLSFGVVHELSETTLLNLDVPQLKVSILTMTM